MMHNSVCRDFNPKKEIVYNGFIYGRYIQVIYVCVSTKIVHFTLA